MRFAIVLALLLVTVLVASKVPLDAIESHHEADTVLYPAFVAAINDWVNQHPRDEAHYRKFDKRDKERFELARKRWRDLDDAMKRAGY